MTNDSTQNPEIFIITQFKSLRKRLRRREAGRGIFRFFTVFFGVSLVFLLFEILFWFPPAWKWGLLLVFLLANALVFYFFCIKPCFPLLFFHYPPDEVLAEQIGSTFPQIKDKLLNALQVYQKRIERKNQVSFVLATEALKQAVSQIQGIDLKKAVPLQPLFSSVKTLSVMLGVSLFFLLWIPGQFKEAFVRWSHPNTHYVPEFPYPLVFKPGSVQILKGQDVEISVQSKGPFPRLPIFLILETRKKKESVLLRAPYRYRINSMTESFQYFFKIGRYTSAKFSVQVLYPPEVRILRVSLIPPAYTGLKRKALEPNAGHVEALLGSRMELEIQATKEISKATVVFQTGKKLPMEVHRDKAKVDYWIFHSEEYWIDLEDSLRLHNFHPIRYWIHVIPDQWPEIRIVSPGPRFDLDRSMVVPLCLEAKDDFGISNAQIGYTLVSPRLVPEDTVYVALPISSSRTYMRWDFPWNVRGLDLFPEDEVHYFAEVCDNDKILGPKQFRTSVYIFRFPSVEEIYQNLERAGKSQVDMMEQVYDRAKEFQKELERFSESMKTQPSLEWETQRAFEKKIQDHISILENLDSLVKHMENFQKEMEQKNALGVETLRKYQELQNLISEMNSPALLEALKEFQEALQSIDPQRLREVLDKVQISEEDLLQSLERTISLFKKLLTEQKLDEWAGRLKDMAKRQMEINKHLGQEKEVSPWVREEEILSQDAKALYQAIQNLDPNLKKELEMASVDMEAILDSLIQASLPEKLSDISQTLKKNNSEEALQKGQSAVQSMKGLQTMMEAVRDQMRSSHKTAVLNALDRISRQAVQLSQEQETLSHAFEHHSISPTQTAERQYAMMSSLDQIADSLFALSQQTFGLSPKIGKALGEAKKSMMQGLSALASGDSQKGIRSQKEAMAGLNRTVIEIQNTMEEMSNASSGLGLDMLLGQLEELGLEQLALHQKLMELLQKGQFAFGEQVSMARLAETQEMLKRRLEQLAEMYGNQGNVLGNLDAIARDMEEVIQDFKQKKVDQKTVEKENRILSRLLDAAHALYQQDFGEKRKAKAGRDIFRIPVQKGEQRKGISMPVDPAREGYTIEYQELIRRYFERMRP